MSTPDPRAIVFDCLDWQKSGGDKGDNSCFHKKVTIVHRRSRFDPAFRKQQEWMVDVVWDHNGKKTEGHFEEGIKYICRYCDTKETAFPGARECTNCWETSKRIEDFVQSDRGMLCVKQAIDNVRGVQNDINC